MSELLPYNGNTVHKMIRVYDYWVKAESEDEQVGKYALHPDEEARLPADCSDSSDLLLVKKILKYCGTNNIKTKRSDKDMTLTAWGKSHLPAGVTYSTAARSMSMKAKDTPPVDLFID